MDPGLGIPFCQTETLRPGVRKHLDQNRAAPSLRLLCSGCARVLVGARTWAGDFLLLLLLAQSSLSPIPIDGTVTPATAQAGSAHGSGQKLA